MYVVLTTPKVLITRVLSHVDRIASKGIRMSLDKSIRSGKEKRKPYRGAKACDSSCRNGGGCPYCEGTRTHNAKRRKTESQYDCEECFDTGCVCGGIGLTCDGCCSCATARDLHRNG